MEADNTGKGGAGGTPHGDGDEALPLCTVCNHHHCQGVACAVCGHIKSLPVATKPGPAPSTLHFKCFDAKAKRVFEGFWTLTRLMRVQVFCDEIGLAETAEIEDSVESISRHVYGKVGDAPAAYCRWHIIRDTTSGLTFIELGHILVVGEYRRRGFCAQMVEFVLREDIPKHSKRRRLRPTGVIVDVPDIPHVVRLLSRQGFVHVVDTPFDTQRGPCVRMVLFADPDEATVVLSPMYTGAVVDCACGVDETDPRELGSSAPPLADPEMCRQLLTAAANASKPGDDIVAVTRRR